MVLQVPQVGEALSALVAHELFLPGVYLLVGFQAVALVEAASTHVAAERLLAGVDALVSVQVSRVAETFSTRVAAERFLSCVNHLWEKKWIRHTATQQKCPQSHRQQTSVPNLPDGI